MSRVRTGFVYFLSLFLLATLIGTAVSTSSNNTLGKPKKVEAYLEQSKIYDHFINYTTEQAKKSNGDTDQSDSVSLSDAAIKAAAQASFSKQLIQQSVNKVIEANYAWLEGKTATPEFSVDLTSQKQTFAQKVGQYVTTYTAGLPVCASPEVAAQQSQDPLAATCRPSELTPEAAGAQVTANLSSTGDFLNSPVITASNINPDNNQSVQPYYDKFSHLPQAYQFGTKLPYVFAALSLLAALGVIFVSQNRRKGVRKVGIVLLIAGLSLVALKFFADFGFKRIEGRAFNPGSVGELQHSLTDFAHRIEESMVRTDLWFGIAFILIAAIIFGVLTATRQKDDTPKSKKSEAEPEEESDASTPIVLSRKRITPKQNGPKLGGPPPKSGSPAPKPKKPPRLVQ